MTRTPDEIKRGLDNPIHVHYHISDIEPRLTPLALHDLEFLHADALALIQQLQAENAQQARCIENMTDKLNAMNDEVAKLQTERDAAVRDLKALCGCMACDHAEKDYDSAPYNECTNCNGEVVESKWQWRGVQKEN